MAVYVLLALAAIAIYFYFNFVKSPPQDYELIAPFYEEKCWAITDTDVDLGIHPFKVDIEPSQLEDFKKRLEITRFSKPSLKDSKFQYGVNSKFMNDVLGYWKSSYDWRKQEAILNKFPQYKTKIEGLDIHFVHVKSEAKTSQYQPKPIMLVHGWPGSFFEFHKIIPMLTDPMSYGGNETDQFEVIVPSIPGFGFSQAAEVKGFSSVHCARIFHKLMTRLGHKNYYVQGGDFGALITSHMALLYPNSVRGLHLNMNAYQLSPSTIVKLLLGSLAPSLIFDKHDAKKYFPLKTTMQNLLLESGYMHLHATKPDTVGYALSDSPAGLAAYILEKFSTWTDINGRDQDDGDILKHWTYDELLTNIMIYWWNGNITSSMRFYKENFSIIDPTRKIKIRVPVGFAWCPGEFFSSLKSSVEHKYSRLLSFTRMKDGGHFMAFECPQLLAEDLRNFVRLQMRENACGVLRERESHNEFKQTHLDRIDKVNN